MTDLVMYNSRKQVIINWNLISKSIFNIVLKNNESNITCISYHKSSLKPIQTNCSDLLLNLIVECIRKGMDTKKVSKFILKNSRIAKDLKQINQASSLLLGGGGCGSKSYREVNQDTIVKKEITQAKQRRKRNDQSIVKADIQKLKDEMEAILNTKDEDIYNGKTYIIDNIFPLIDKQGVVSNRVLHQNLSKLLQKAMNLLLRVKSSAGTNDKKEEENNNNENQDEDEIDVEDGLEEDLVWTEKDKACMDQTLTNIIDRINGRIGQEPLLNQVYCVTMVRNILRTHKHALKLMDEAIRYGVPLFGLIRNQDPTLILMLAVKGLNLMAQMKTKSMVQTMMNYQIQVFECVRNLSNEIKGESKNVQLLFAYFNALDDILSKKNKSAWEVQYYCLMQINELLKIMIEQKEAIQIGNSKHWNGFFKDEEKGMFSICQRKFSMSGIFIADAIDSLLLNHKFLRSISLEIIINSLKLINISESKIQSNLNTQIKTEISQVLYQRWLFENNNQVRAQFIDEEVLICVDEFVQKKKGDGEDAHRRRQRQGQKNQEIQIKGESEDDEEKKLVEYAKQEQLALLEIQKQIKSKGNGNSELDKELSSLNDTFECIKSDDGIKKIINLRQTELWKQSILNRRAQGEVQKDDQLLETINLYVNQRLQEKLILEDESDEVEDKKKPKEVDALIFLKNEFIKKKNEKSQHPPLLTIVANGGMGKSMLLKKIEMELLEDFSKNAKDNLYERIPIIVKMADLDAETPNLIEYLDNQPIFKELRLDAEVLKTSNLNKLILFDAFDEYKGKPFNLWSILKLGEWTNTKIIITSREENLAKEDYNQYFSVNNQGDSQKKTKEQSFLLYKLIQFGKEQLTEFAKKCFDQEKKQEDNKQVDLLAEFNRIINENEKVLLLISLPINAFIFIKTLPSLLKQNQTISIRDQTELQELFFNNQFEREALMLPKAGTDADLRDLYKKQFFVLFQRIAIHMFKQSTLNADISEVQIDIIPQLKKKISSKEQKNLLQQLRDYRNPQIISLVDQDGRDLDLIKFIHKSLFEYFVARSMKYDFDQVQQNNQKLLDLSFEEISNFAINSKYIMDKGSGEISILQQFARMIKPAILSVEFQQKCSSEESIQGHHNYIQIILLTRRQYFGEKLDIASSNMLSAIAYNKPALNGLKLTRCSFKKAYLYNYRGNIDVTGSNLRESMLGQSFIDYSRSKTEFAQTQDAQSLWGGGQLYSFNACLIPSNQKNPNKLTVLTGSFGGYLNEFSFDLNGEYSKDDNDFYIVSGKKSYEIKRSKRLYQGVIRFLYQYENKYIVVQQNNIIVVDENGEELYLFQAHKEDIIKIDINHQLKHLATLDKGKCIKIWNISKQFSLISSFEDAHEQEITQISYSQSQNILVSCSKDKSCKVWKMEGNEYVFKYKIDFPQPIEIISFTPDGKQLFTVLGFMKGVFLYNVDENKAEQATKINIMLSFTNQLLFSPDGKYLLVSYSNSVSVFDVNKNYEKIDTLRFNNYKTYVTNFCFSNNSKYIVTTGYDNSCAVWDVSQNFKLVSSNTGHQDIILDLCYSPDGKYFISTSQQYFYIWQTIKNPDGSLNYELLSINHAYNHFYARALSFKHNYSADSYIFTIATKTDHFIIYEFKPSNNSVTQIKLLNRENKENSPISLQFSPNDSLLLSATAKELNLFNVASDYDILKKFEPSGDQQITCGCFYSDQSRDYHLTIIGYNNNIFELWDISEKQYIEKYKTINVSSPLRQIVCSPSGRSIATAVIDNTIQIWDTQKDFTLQATITHVKEDISKIAFSFDSQYIACISSDKYIRVWSAASNFESFQIIQYGEKSENSCICFHPQNSKILLSSFDQKLNVWDLEKGYEIDTKIQGHNQCVVASAISGDGNYLISSCRDAYMKLWNCPTIQDSQLVPNYELISTIHLNSPKKFTINRIKFMQDNRHFVTACSDGTIRMWSIEQMTITPGLVIPSEGDKQEILSIDIYPKTNAYIAAACQDQGCKIFTSNGDQTYNNLSLFKKIYDNTPIRSVAFSPNQKYLAVGSNNCITYIYDSQERENQKPLFSLLFTLFDNEYPYYIDNLKFSIDSRFLVIGYFHIYCYVYNIENKFHVQTLGRYNNSVSDMDISNDGSVLSLSCYDNSFYIYKYDQNVEDKSEKQEVFKKIKKNTDHKNKIYTLTFCKGNSLLATGSMDQTVKIWNFKDSNKLDFTNIQTI